MNNEDVIFQESMVSDAAIGETPLVVILILNFNSANMTASCLDSLSKLEYPNYKILVIDNGSSDDSVEEIVDQYPDVHFIRLEFNLGFAQGNNIGLSKALEMHADYCLLLNNDTIVAPDFLTHLVDSMNANQCAAAAGPSIYYHEDPARIWSAGGVVDTGRGNAFMMNIGELECGQFHTSHREVDFVTGCAILVRTRVLEHVGMLDPRFFLYFEEVEWCMRMRKHGYSILHIPASNVWHKISVEDRESSHLVHYYMTRNRLLFIHEAELGLRAMFYALIIDYARTLISWTIRPRWKERRCLRRTVLRGIQDYFKGNFGKTNIFL